MTALTMALDASTYEGSVALIRGREVVQQRIVAMRGEREERLMPAVAEVLSAQRVNPSALNAIVCGAGPGSFTSLRIAASIAKGLAHGLSLPVYAVSSLALAAVEAGEGRWVVSIDALRGERFVGAYVWDGSALSTLMAPSIAERGELDALADQFDARLAAAAPHARSVAPILQSLMEARPVDLGSWEPDYGRLAEAQVRWEAAHGRGLG
jgi:tRNA threonylcarbamoyladenosine biosynthesis protein TsaB